MEAIYIGKQSDESTLLYACVCVWVCECLHLPHTLFVFVCIQTNIFVNICIPNTVLDPSIFFMGIKILLIFKYIWKNNGNRKGIITLKHHTTQQLMRNSVLGTLHIWKPVLSLFRFQQKNRITWSKTAELIWFFLKDFIYRNHYCNFEIMAKFTRYFIH